MRAPARKTLRRRLAPLETFPRAIWTELPLGHRS
jgi:hypothetical protein